MEQEVTSGQTWRKPREEGFLLTLFSGNVARLRAVSIPALMAQGEIPDLLSAIAAQTVWAGPQSLLPEDLDDLLTIPDVEERRRKIAAWFEEMSDTMPKMLILTDIVVRAAFVEPEIVPADHEEELEPHQMRIEDVDDQDKAQVYQLVTQGVRVLRSFRDQQVRDAANLQDHAGDGHASQRVDGSVGEVGAMDSTTIRQRRDTSGKRARKRQPRNGEGGDGRQAGMETKVQHVRTG